MSNYHEPWSQGKFLLSDVTGGTPSKDVIKNIDELQSKQIYVHFATDKQRRIAITNDPLIAKRIVDCVNACAGITSEALQAGYIKYLVEWDKVNHDCIDRIDSKITPFEFKGKKILEDTDGK